MDAQQSRDQEVERLSAQVARLQAQLRTRPAPVRPPSATRKPGLGRRFLAALLITLGVLLAPISVVAAWTKTELTDTDQFVATAAPILDDPAFQTFLVDEVTAAINEEIDLEAITSDLFDGIAGLDLSPRAAEALQLLEQPAVEGAQAQIRTAAERLIASDAFAQVWDQALRISHARMTAVLSGDTSGAVVVSDTGEVGIQLGPVIAAVKERLAAQGFTLADRIPEVDRTVVVAQSEELVQARSAYRVLVLLGFVLPWVSLGLLAAGVLVASGRARVMIWVGLGLALTMALLGLGVTLGRIFTVAAVSQHLPADVAEAVYDALVPGLYSTAVAVGVLGATSAVVAYLAGPFRGAVTVRRLTAQAVGRTRRGHAARPAAAATDVKDSGEEAVGQETDGAAPQATVTAPE